MRRWGDSVEQHLQTSALFEAYKVNVTSSAAEGDFMIYRATVVEVIKNIDTGEWNENGTWLRKQNRRQWLQVPSNFSFSSLRDGQCRHTGGPAEKSHLQHRHHPEQPAVLGDGSKRNWDHRRQELQVRLRPLRPLTASWFLLLLVLLCSCRYRLPLDSDALVEQWPTLCTTHECRTYLGELNDYALELQLSDCPSS